MYLNRQMGVFVLLINVLCLSECKLRRDRKKRAYKHLRYENCGKPWNSTIQVFQASAHPMPIPSPGKLRVTMGVNITEDLPQSLAIDLKLWKRIWLFGKYPKIWIPCYSGIGSCYYKEVCGYLSQYAGTGCPRAFRRRGLPCHCPFPAGLYTANRLTFRIPTLTGVWGYFAKGSYEAEIRLYDHLKGSELGCVKVFFSIRRRKRRRKHNKTKTSRIQRHSNSRRRIRNHLTLINRGTH